jgi:hypothetical protein
VPKKCNVLIIINNKYIVGLARRTRTRVIGGSMIPQERGLEGISIYFINLITHFV